MTISVDAKGTGSADQFIHRQDERVAAFQRETLLADMPWCADNVRGSRPRSDARGSASLFGGVGALLRIGSRRS